MRFWLVGNCCGFVWFQIRDSGQGWKYGRNESWKGIRVEGTFKGKRLLERREFLGAIALLAGIDSTDGGNIGGAETAFGCGVIYYLWRWDFRKALLEVITWGVCMVVVGGNWRKLARGSLASLWRKRVRWRFTGKTRHISLAVKGKKLGMSVTFFTEASGTYSRSKWWKLMKWNVRENNAEEMDKSVGEAIPRGSRYIQKRWSTLIKCDIVVMELCRIVRDGWRICRSRWPNLLKKKDVWIWRAGK